MASASDQETLEIIDKLLGYLNFSSGASDPQFLSGLNTLFVRCGYGENDCSWRQSDSGPSVDSQKSDDGDPATPCWQRVIDRMQSRLAELQKESSAFANAEQATAVLRVLRDDLVGGFRDFHRDALFHRGDEALFTPFMLGRMFESLLEQPQPWDSDSGSDSGSDSEVVSRSLERLNSYLGHRPVATLESQKIEPYPHEWIRPVPVYIEEAGVAASPYQELIASTLEILRAVDADIARAAYFDVTALQELAIDPRAYDFDHPANRRPNHHFGEWDPQHIDNDGRYRRFVMREVTLQSMMDRVDDAALADIPREELLWEASAVLAGTILMATGISGYGPGAHDSNTTLITLVTRIATYRDAFYERLLDALEGPRAERLGAEVETLRQPLGGARQDLNNRLARKRAAQIERIRLAKVFARMGYVDAAQQLVDEVQVTSARINTRIDCALTAGHQALRRGEFPAVLERLDKVVDRMHRGVKCGAIVDPWNILGFDANFSLFPALENSIRDHRVDELAERMDRIFDLFARLWSAAAAVDDQEMADQVRERFDSFAQWWHQFAAHEVASVECNSAIQEFAAAEQVAEALNSWHRGGAATGDVGFWAPFVENFDSPKAYALVIETLLDKSDFVSSMSLLMHWISQSPPISLESGQSSFHQIALRWIRAVVQSGLGGVSDGAVVPPAAASQADGSESLDPDAAWKLLRRFFDFLEPNAEHYWSPPTYERLHGSKNGNSNGAKGPDDGELADGAVEDDDDGLYQAAYEDVVFQDSTADGVDGSVFESQAATSEEMERQASRVLERLAFHNGLARFWTTVSVAVGNAIAFKPDAGADGDTEEDAKNVFSDQTIDGLASAFEEWYRRSVSNREKLFALLDEVGSESIPKPAGHHDSMVDYDRQRMVRDSLIDNVVSTIVRVSQAERFLLSTLMISSDDWDAEAEKPEDDTLDPVASELEQVAELFASAIERDHETATERCDSLLEALEHREMLYVPLAKSGAPRRIANVRIRHRIIEDLLIALPRLGMVSHTARLIETVRVMEQNVPAGRGAVTQFDELFEVGLRELVVCLVCATEAASGKDLAATSEDADDEQPDVDEHLIECLEQLTEIVLRSWLDHSRTLRLSVLERVRHPDSWDELVEFIQQYGSDVFTQGFMKRANIRAILHCGVDSWLTQLEESGIDPPFELMHQLGDALPREQAVKHLTLSLESVIENYNAYLDYNSTTTQSDRGEKLFMLLDFLRLRSNYDRVAWNLRPVVISHDVLVRRTRNAAAQLWRRALTDRVGREAERYMKGLGELQSKYAMRMASVADRIGERFQRPMTIDRMRALVQPAIQQLHDQQEPHAFQILEDETRLLMREPTGAGMDVPQWLMALEDEVESLQPWSANERMQIEDDLWMQPTPLDLEELHRQLDELR